jgi:hypothetical protein
MRVHFPAPTPRFGRANNRLPVAHQQRSPYFWWWECLRRNEGYLQCCANGGGGEFAAIYADFGDVRGGSFHAWWTEGERGVRLFAEQPLTIQFGELTSPADWKPEWTPTDVMVVAVPLGPSKRYLRGMFAKLLDKRHTGRKGRPAISKQASTARYRLARNYTIANLRTMIAVYDFWLENQRAANADKLALWEIGQKLNLNKAAIRNAISANKQERMDGRNVLATTVSRYVKQAKSVISNSALGLFPVG